MANPSRYGPWATTIDVGPNPQLSSFWRRRLTMLVPASRTSPLLSPQNLLWLTVAAAVVIALPTFRNVPALAAEEQPAAAEKKLIGGHNAGSPATLEESFCSTGPSTFYANMRDAELVAKIGLTPQQCKQLDALAEETRRALSQAIDEDAERTRQLVKKIEALPKEKREETGKSLFAEEEQRRRERDQRNKREMRQKVEAVLTPQQLQKVKDIVYPELTFAKLHDPKTLDEIGLSEQQKDQVRELYLETSRKHQKAAFDHAETWAGIFTAEQQDKLRKEAQRRVDKTIADREAGRRFFGGASNLAAVMMIGDEDRFPAQPELVCAMVRKRLQVTEEQERRLGELVARMWARESELMKPLTQNGKTDWTAYTARQESVRKQLYKENRQQIDAILTPQQLSALKEFVLMRETAYVLFDRDSLTGIGATDQQRAKLRQAFDEASKACSLVFEQASQQALKLLTPPQHESLHKKFDQEGWW
jgi:Spy/CpxP family protein refolding chaperone